MPHGSQAFEPKSQIYSDQYVALDDNFCNWVGLEAVVFHQME